MTPRMPGIVICCSVLRQRDGEVTIVSSRRVKPGQREAGRVSQGWDSVRGRLSYSADTGLFRRSIRY